MFKKYIQTKLEKYVRAYFIKHPEVKLVVVTGSVGKTSTKIAIATVLSQRLRVRLHDGNHNALMSTPLAILGVEYPDNIKSIGTWLAVFRAARRRIKQPTDVDVIVQELGSDRIGEIAHYATYLHPDLAVVTAVSPEHMEYFHDINTVALEELTAANFSKQALINRDDISGSFANLLTNGNINTYGTTAAAEYRFEIDDFVISEGYTGAVIVPSWEMPIPAQIHVVGEHSLRPAIAAAAVAVQFGFGAAEISKGLGVIRPVSGRMNILRGLNNSIIIDDTYNSSPLAAASALQTLYMIEAPQRIAIIGSMNELGDSSTAEHQALGALCNPNELAWVITVGEQAEKYLAPVARGRGCQVKSFKNALEAGAFVHSVLDENAVVLFKGSEGGIYLEEAVKIILHATEEDTQLVRQSSAWLVRKTAFFSE